VNFSLSDRRRAAGPFFPEDLMRVFVIACAAAILIAGGAALMLSQLPQSAETAFSTPGARV
jgi:hypothetical protein